MSARDPITINTQQAQATNFNVQPTSPRGQINTQPQGITAQQGQTGPAQQGYQYPNNVATQTPQLNLNQGGVQNVARFQNQNVQPTSPRGQINTQPQGITAQQGQTGSAQQGHKSPTNTNLTTPQVTSNQGSAQNATGFQNQNTNTQQNQQQGITAQNGMGQMGMNNGGFGGMGMNNGGFGQGGMNSGGFGGMGMNQGGMNQMGMNNGGFGQGFGQAGMNNGGFGGMNQGGMGNFGQGGMGFFPGQNRFGGMQMNAKPPENIRTAEKEEDKSGWYSGSVDVKQWFENITGYTESQYAYKYQEELCKKTDGKVTLNGKEYNTGTFKIESIGDLKKELDSHDQPNGQFSNFPLRIYVPTKDTSMPLYFYELGVSTLQADAKNNNCMFQVASNFSCIEPITETTFPDSANFITNYYRDNTQGPAASISAGAAGIERVLNPRGPDYGNQTSDNQINLLDDLKEYYNIENGYIVNDTTSKGIKTFGDKEFDSITDKVKVGYLKGAEVTYGGKHQGRLNVLKTPHTINQVFTAAMNLRQGEHGKANAILPDKEIKARALLRGAYMGTYLSAIKTGSKRLFLTLIGGGSFGNDIYWILSEILYAHKYVKEKVKNDVLQSVELVLFNVPPCLNQFLQDLNTNGIPHTFTEISLRPEKPNDFQMNNTQFLNQQGFQQGFQPQFGQQMMGQQGFQQGNQQIVQQWNQQTNQPMMGQQTNQQTNHQMMGQQMNQQGNQQFGQQMVQQWNQQTNQPMMGQQANQQTNQPMMGQQANQQGNQQIVGQQTNQQGNQQSGQQGNQQMMAQQTNQQTNQQMMGQQMNQQGNQQSGQQMVQQWNQQMDQFNPQGNQQMMGQQMNQ